MSRVSYVLNLIIVFLLLGTIAINRDGKIGGNEIYEYLDSTSTKPVVKTEWIDADGNCVVTSVNLAQNIYGYASGTPVTIWIKENRILKIEAAENNESPEFMNFVIQSNLLHKWDGLTPQQAMAANVDAVSGATMTSDALIKTINRTLEYICQVEPQQKADWVNWKTIIGVLVIVSGIMFSFLKPKSKWWRYVQLSLNVIVLGIWCGSFISISLLVNSIADGVNLSVATLTFILLMVAIVMPFLGRKATYCTWHCPMGSLQELIGKCAKRKLPISTKVLNILNRVRDGILLTMLFIMWLGVGFEIMNYEVFTFFLFHQASIVVLSLGFLFIGLSFFIQRPYCRFMCPTGALLKFTENTTIKS